MRHRFLVSLVVGLSMLTGVAVYATSSVAARTAGIGLVCTIVLKATALGHIIYRLFIGH
jgi:hypothetical protein